MKKQVSVFWQQHWRQRLLQAAVELRRKKHRQQRQRPQKQRHQHLQKHLPRQSRKHRQKALSRKLFELPICLTWEALPLAVTAREKGYFEEMGLTVDLVEFQGGPAEIAAMAAGDIAISQIGHGAHALCAEGEAVIFQIDCTSLADAVIGNADKGISSIADLKGKKVAATSGTSAEIILNLALKSAGLTSDDLEIVEMDANGMVSAMVSGNVDACATWSPGTVTISEALGDKTVWLATNQDYINEATFPSSFITTQKYADEHHDILVRFSRALQKAADYRNEHIEEVAEMVAKQCEVDASTMLACVGEGNWTITSDFQKKALEDGTIQKYYENQQQVFIDGGRLTEKVDVNKYVLFDVMKEANEANNK